MQPRKNRVTGIGLRSAHYDALLATRPDVGWLEVHPENYFCGGLHALRLQQARELYPVSLHGVGLSLGSAQPVSMDHLGKLKALADRISPIRISEHASWSASGNVHLNDLLPLPYNTESLDALCGNVRRTQDFLNRQILIENPSTYLTISTSTMDEPQFLVEACRRTGCALLLDINNIYVQARNHSMDALAYIQNIPVDIVQEIHLAGHIERMVEGQTLLIDTHSRPVCDDVWRLYEAAIDRFGNVPALIEWDGDIPALDVLVAEAHQADALIFGRSMHAAA